MDACSDCIYYHHGDHNDHVTIYYSGVDTTTPGTCAVTHRCTDSSDQEDTASRTVIVEDPPQGQ